MTQARQSSSAYIRPDRRLRAEVGTALRDAKRMRGRIRDLLKTLQGATAKDAHAEIVNSWRHSAGAGDSAAPAPVSFNELPAKLRTLPSVFERLIYVVLLFKQAPGASGEGPDGAKSKQIVQQEHRAAFEHWLALKLRDKVEDLELCAERHARSPLDVLREWIPPQSHRMLIPSMATQPQRSLFELEFEILLPIVAANMRQSEPLSRGAASGEHTTQ